MRKKKEATRHHFQTSSKQGISLPSTYRKLFFFTYRTNFLLIFKTSLVISLFAIPLFVALYLRGLFITSITSESLEADLSKNIMSFQGVYGFVLLASFLVLAIGILGATNVMIRQLKNQGVSFWRDFRAGIKNNWLKGLGITLFYFGLLAIFNYVINLFYFKSDFPIYPVSLVIFIFLSVFIFIQWSISLMTSIIYTCPFGKMLKNSFLMNMAKLPITLFGLLISIAPFIVAWAVGYVPVLFGAFLVYVCIGFGHGILTIVIINLYVFDELVNKKSFPSRYREGLFDNDEIGEDEGFNP